MCIDKITCGRMYERIIPRWNKKIVSIRAKIVHGDPEHDQLERQAKWLEETIIEIIVSESQNEVEGFKKWGVDIIPHRDRMKKGFETPDGKRVDVESAFKDPDHPFRVAIICAMWLTGFDVECLSTMYIDKPMKAHTLMPAIARANRVYPGKDSGLIVDYNGMLRSLRQALAQYALGSDETPSDVVMPIEERARALLDAIEETEAHLAHLGFDAKRLMGAKGWARIEALHDAENAVYTSDESKRRFEILGRQVFERFKALIPEPTIFHYAERHDNIEAIYKTLTERRDTADVTALLKELHKIVNDAIRTQAPGDDQAQALRLDLSRIDLTKLRDEFAQSRRATTIHDIRQVVEAKLARMLQQNPQRMDYNRRYQEIVADYNREKDRTTIEQTFAQLVDLIASLDAEQKRAAEEGLNEEELALFDLLQNGDMTKAERERVKQASRSLLTSLRGLLAQFEHWIRNTQTQAEVQVLILDNLYRDLPTPPFTDEQKQAAATRIYDHVWKQSADSSFAVTTNLGSQA